MKKLTINHRNKSLLLLVLTVVLAFTTFTVGCAKEPDPPELKSVKLKDTYTLKDGTIKVTPLIAVYYDKQEDREFEKQLTDYRFYVNDQEMEIDEDGMLQIKKGKYTFRVEWINDGVSDQYEKEVRVKGQKTWGKYPKLIGKTYGEIKQAYGELDTTDTRTYQFGYYVRIKGFDIWIVLHQKGVGTITNIPKDEYVCAAATGSISTFFNNIKSQMTREELQSLLNISLQSVEDSEGKECYYGVLPDGNTIEIYIGETGGEITPKTNIVVMMKNYSERPGA